MFGRIKYNLMVVCSFSVLKNLVFSYLGFIWVFAMWKLWGTDEFQYAVALLPCVWLSTVGFAIVQAVTGLFGTGNSGTYNTLTGEFTNDITSGDNIFFLSDK